ncbi:unnamed protein product [Linum tenue]|uniref:Uncharacterized protein n=1 Tax=Linum tenue TaxID=586396 RepID=A0AAV0QZ49_9ROSI|nr:unnamed protein product [Linum tenue]
MPPSSQLIKSSSHRLLYIPTNPLQEFNFICCGRAGESICCQQILLCRQRISLAAESVPPKKPPPSQSCLCSQRLHRLRRRHCLRRLPSAKATSSDRYQHFAVMYGGFSIGKRAEVELEKGDFTEVVILLSRVKWFKLSTPLCKEVVRFKAIESSFV